MAEQVSEPACLPYLQQYRLQRSDRSKPLSGPMRLLGRLSCATECIPTSSVHGLAPSLPLVWSLHHHRLLLSVAARWRRLTPSALPAQLLPVGGLHQVTMMTDLRDHGADLGDHAQPTLVTP